jgi:hypothetical protein
MKKIKYLLLIILVLFVVNVKAEDKCAKEELTRLKELAKKVEFDYDYGLVNDIANFSISVYNLNEELDVLIIEDYYMDKYQRFLDLGEHVGTLDGFKSGEKVTVTIKAFVDNKCAGETLLTKTIKLPYYNYFYDDNICVGHVDFKYCKILLDSNITQTIFDEQYITYLENKENNNKIIIPVENNWTLIIIIGSIVLVLLVLVTISMIIVRKRRRNSL